MNDLIETVEKLPENLEKSMLKSIEIQEKEHEKIYYDIKELKKDNDKMQLEITELRKIVDERTVEEDSNNYNNCNNKFYIRFSIKVIKKYDCKSYIGGLNPSTTSIL